MGYRLWDFITLQPCPESELLLASAGVSAGMGATSAIAATPRGGGARRASTMTAAAATGVGALSRAVQHRLETADGAAAQGPAAGADLLEEAASVVYGEVGNGEEETAAGVADLAAASGVDAAANGGPTPFTSGPGHYGAEPPVEFNMRTFDAMITM